MYALVSPIKYIVLAVIILTASVFLKPYVPVDILKYATISIVGLTLLAYILRYLYIRSIQYTVTSEQIIYKRGIFSITKDYIELYRVIDFQESRPFLLRLIGGMNFVLETTDKSHPIFKLEAIPRTNIDDTIRYLVEDNRERKRVFVTE